MPYTDGKHTHMQTDKSTDVYVSQIRQTHAYMHAHMQRHTYVHVCV